MTTLEEAAALARQDRGLVVDFDVAVQRHDPSVRCQCGCDRSPGTGETVLGVVTAGRIKLANLRARSQVTATFRNGWQWAAVEGHAELVGPDDPQPWLDTEGLRQLRREIFAAAGGEHDNWDEYDRVMDEERRAAVLIRPDRIYSN